MPQPPAAPRFLGTATSPSTSAVDVLFVPVFGPEDRLDDLPDLDAAVGGEFSRALRAGEFKARLHDVFLAAVASPRWKASRVAFVGAGDRAEVTPERARRVAATCGYAARQRSVGSVGIVARLGLTPRLLADGVSAAEFDSGCYKSGDRPGPFAARVEIIASGGSEPAVAEAVRIGRTIGEAANFARSLANEPGNVLTPRELAARVTAAASAAGVAVDVLDEVRIRELGMRLMLGVAQGSAEPPRLIVLRHDPPGAPASPVLGFVGKGVTFDSGGISIKPADGMDRMKDDMAGGAAVAAALCAVAALGGAHRVLGVIPTVENMPGGRAIRPGDVIVGASGTSVEILNTDAEGRLILADALWYAREQGATHLVDVATLTGACLVALGRSVSGLFGAPDPWVRAVQEAGRRAGDRLWPMPIYEETREELRSEIADLVNAAGRAGGAITAAAFLREFAHPVPWAHLDIAGTAWAETRQPYQPKGATGVAVRTLIELAMTGGHPAAMSED
jgi:leucyl aminopeptidase